MERRGVLIDLPRARGALLLRRLLRRALLDHGRLCPRRLCLGGFEKGVLIVVELQLPRGVLGLGGELRDLDGATQIGGWHTKFASGLPYPAIWSAALGFCAKLARNLPKFGRFICRGVLLPRLDDLDPSRLKFAALKGRDLSAVQVFRDLRELPDRYRVLPRVKLGQFDGVDGIPSKLDCGLKLP